MLARTIVKPGRKAHSRPVPLEPANKIFEELAALFKRADAAIEVARRLLDENDCWRRSVLTQLDYMFELGAEFRRLPVTRPLAAMDKSRSEDRSPAAGSACDAVPTRPGSA